MELDKRIGKHGEFAPELNVAGLPYEKPASTFSLGNGYFVALPAFGDVDEKVIGELRLLVPLPETPKASKKVAATESTTNEPT